MWNCHNMWSYILLDSSQTEKSTKTFAEKKENCTKMLQICTWTLYNAYLQESWGCVNCPSFCLLFRHVQFSVIIFAGQHTYCYWIQERRVWSQVDQSIRGLAFTHKRTSNFRLVPGTGTLNSLTIEDSERPVSWGQVIRENFHHLSRLVWEVQTCFITVFK